MSDPIDYEGFLHPENLTMAHDLLETAYADLRDGSTLLPEAVRFALANFHADVVIYVLAVIGANGWRTWGGGDDETTTFGLQRARTNTMTHAYQTTEEVPR